MTQPLMPKATAVWLIDNTSLTFDQIADFCKLHPLEVRGIADGDVAAGVRGFDPIANGQLTREELEKAQNDDDYRLKILQPKTRVPQPKKKGPRYTPVSRRQDRPDAILWMVRNHPEISDAQISKLLGTTKPTIESVRSRTHWNSASIKPVDPVTLGLCSQIELDEVVRKAAAKRARMEAANPKPEEGPTLEQVEDKPREPNLDALGSTADFKPKVEETPDADAVFSNFGGDDDASAEDAKKEDGA